MPSPQRCEMQSWRGKEQRSPLPEEQQAAALSTAPSVLTFPKFTPDFMGCKCKLQSWIRSLCDTHHLLPTSGDAEHKYYTCYSSMSQGLHAGVSIFNRHAARSEDCVSLAQLTLPYQPIKSNRYRLNTAKYNRASLRHVKGAGKDPCTSPSTSGWELLPVQMQFERGESLLCCPQTAAGRQHCTHCPAWTAEPSEMCQH